MSSISPLISEDIQSLLREASLLHEAKKLGSGPLHILLPSGMNRNLRDFRRALIGANVDHYLYFAHKATKSKAFLNQALRLGIGIDVASREELCSSLSSGFTGLDTECTGIKSDSFLQLAILHECLIVADSISELKRIVSLKKKLERTRPIPVIVRLAVVNIPGRSLQSRLSKFGVPLEELSHLFQFFEEHADVVFTGFHLHTDEREVDIRAGQLEGLLHLMMDAFREGLNPQIVNIGGGFRRQQLADPSQWIQYIGELEEALVHGKALGTWKNFAYDMRLNDSGKVQGRAQAIAKCTVPSLENVIEEMFHQGDVDGRSNGDFIRDNGFTIVLEPGQALLEQCGISLFSVVEVKKSQDSEDMVVLDGSMYNLSVSMREYVMDPILIPSKNESQESEFDCYLVGSLCREEDFLMKRKVTLKSRPNPGDLICFVNTAAYRIDFEDASPHQKTTGRKIVAVPSSAKWSFYDEETYNAFDVADRPNNTEDADIQSLTRSDFLKGMM